MSRTMNTAQRICSALILIATQFTVEVRADELWVGAGIPPPHYSLPTLVDSADVFKPNAPWPIVEKNTTVMFFCPGNILSAPEDQLAAAFSDMKSRGIALGLEISMLNKGQNDPRRNEAYHPPGLVGQILGKIQRNGGDLKYIRMDEPFFFGHLNTGAGARNESAEALAQNVAENIRDARRFFPKVLVGDVEVIGNSASYVPEYAHWLSAYEKAVGEPLAFFHCDVAWSHLALTTLPPLVQLLRTKHIPFGMIYCGAGDVQSDQAWAKSTIDHYTELESGMKLRPDDRIFESWTNFPSHMLPENKFGTLTNVVLRYLQPATTINLQYSGSSVLGTVTDTNGRLIPNAKISVKALDLRGRLNATVREVTGTVPPGAKSAVIGIRVNAEGSEMDSQSTGGFATLGFLSYSDSGQNVRACVNVPGHKADNTPFQTLSIMPGKKFTPNLKVFSPVPGSQFRFSVPMIISEQAERSGHACLIFLDAQQHGLLLSRLRFEPSEIDVENLVTDANGSFRFSLSPALVSSGAAIKVLYDGNARLRGAMSTVRR